MSRNQIRSLPLVATLLGITLAAVWSLLRVAPRIPHPDAFRYDEPWPFPSLGVVESYERSSPFSAWTTYALGLNESPWLAVFRLGLACIAVALVALWVYVSIDVDGQKARGVRLILLAPAGAVLFLMLGSYDPFTVLGIGLVLFAWRSRSRTWMVITGSFLGVQHFEQAIVAILALCIVAVALDSRLPSALSGNPSPFWLLPGIIVGKVMLLIALTFAGVPALQGRSDWLTDSYFLKQAIVGAVNFGPVFLASLFAGLWAVVVLVLTMQTSRKSLMLIGLALLLLVVVSTVTLDHTRVFAMISLPVLALLVVYVLSSKGIPHDRRLLIVVESMAWIIPPLVVEGVETIYVGPLNVLDHWIMFVQGNVPLFR
jgi:hypothetical protein